MGVDRHRAASGEAKCWGARERCLLAFHDNP